MLTDEQMSALADAFACGLARDQGGIAHALDQVGNEEALLLLEAVQRIRSECRRKLRG